LANTVLVLLKFDIRSSVSVCDDAHGIWDS
jgi:hypothetical protein